MPHVTANDIRIEYGTFGDPSMPALLLIAGNNAQMISWDSELCESLAKKGLFVIHFDNRDCGLSTKFDKAGLPDLMAVIRAAMEGKAVEAPYTLDDMAGDCAGLLDALGIGKAHVCGMSMGGMIAQVMAYWRPERVLSLTTIMSNTGNPEAPQGKPEAMAAVLAPAPEERNAYIKHSMTIWRKIWSPGFPFEEERARAIIETSYDRCFCPQGMVRQNAAIIATGDRRPFLSAIKAPTLVIHGADDPLIPLEAGKDAARTIPGAEFLVIEGMGHDLPKGVWPRLVEAISRHARKAGA